MYTFIPNTKVNSSSCLTAGLVAGIIFVVVQRIYIYFQVGMAHYNAVYGSFAALPLFLVWLQLSWFIVLFGAELSYDTTAVAGLVWRFPARSTARLLRK